MTTYQFFKPADLEAAKSLVPESLVIRGGVIECKGGILVDGELHDTTIESKDGTAIYISAMAKLYSCTLKGTDILIEGTFDGVINGTGKIEFASGCVAVGVCNKGSEVYMHPLADLDDLRVKSVKAQPTVTEVKTVAIDATVSFPNAYRTGT